MEAQDRYESLLQKTLKQTDIMGLLEGKMGAKDITCYSSADEIRRRRNLT